MLVMVLVLLLFYTRKHDKSTDDVGHLVLERVKDSDSESETTKGGGKLLSSSSSDRHERTDPPRAAHTLARTTPGAP
jgi:hypothetical protein